MAEKKASATAPKEYNIATLADMALIPASRRAAFLKELPRILEKARPFAIAMKELPNVVKAEQLIWVDDGIADGSADETVIRFVPQS